MTKIAVKQKSAKSYNRCPFRLALGERRCILPVDVHALASVLVDMEEVVSVMLESFYRDGEERDVNRKREMEEDIEKDNE